MVAGERGRDALAVDGLHLEAVDVFLDDALDLGLGERPDVSLEHHWVWRRSVNVYSTTLGSLGLRLTRVTGRVLPSACSPSDLRHPSAGPSATLRRVVEDERRLCP
jgi:hypothetical protein